MNWRKEKRPKIDEEKDTKKHIKRELMNYYLYLNEYYKLEEKAHEVGRVSSGGSIIKMPDGVMDGLSPQERASKRVSAIEEIQEYYEDKLDKLDSWMNILTESQHNIVKEYVLKNQCEDMHKAALELKYSEETIKKFTKRAIDRIYSRIRKIL